MENILHLKAVFDGYNRTINEINQKKEKIAEKICRIAFPYETGQKVLVRLTKDSEFVPAYFYGAKYDKCYNYESHEFEYFAVPKLYKMKKDGSISKKDIYISPVDIVRGVVVIKPYVEE